ncbi:hypothetical protein AgCh_012859 [Apium graveolens]
MLRLEVELKLTGFRKLTSQISKMMKFKKDTKRCVPLTYVSWEHAPTTLKETLWDYAKARAEKNFKSRHEFTDTHTVGPKLFSQVRHDMIRKMSHAPGWLIGRHDTKTVKKATSVASSDQYL